MAAAVLVGATACASPGVPKAAAFVTRDHKVVITTPPTAAGEAIINVENDDGATHVVVLARLAAGTGELPVVNGVVPAGSTSSQTFTGAGYDVVAKTRRMSAYFNGPNRVREEFHLYLSPGRYVLFANAAGDYAGGLATTWTVA